MENYSKLLNSIRNSALSGMCNRMVLYYDEQDLTAFPDYDLLVTDFKDLTLRLSEALERSRIVSVLAELDAERDAAFRAIHFLLQAFALSRQEERKGAADALLRVFNRYGMQTVKMAYDGQTGYLVSFIKDMEANDLAALVLLLPGMSDAMEDLKSTQQTFVEQQNAYDAERTLYKETMPSASVVKRELLDLLNGKLVSYHRALASLKDDDFVQMAQTINQIIEDENALTKSRHVGD